MTSKIIKINDDTKIEITRHENEGVLSETPYVNGKKHGMRLWWDENGQKYREEMWIDGKLHGMNTLWNKDGAKWLERTWRNGNLHGTETWRWDNGEIQREIYYIAGKEYTRIEWNENGGIIKVNFPPLRSPQQLTPLLNQKNHIKRKVS